MQLLIKVIVGIAITIVFMVITAIYLDEVVFNIIVNSLTAVGYIYLAAKQRIEMHRLHDSITPLRYLIMSVYLFAIFTIIPVIAYQLTVLSGDPSHSLRVASTFLSPLTKIATVILLIIFVNYRIKE